MTAQNPNIRNAQAVLAGLSPLPDDYAQWMRDARQAAADRLLADGLPHKRDEYWRFSDPKPLCAALNNQPAHTDHDQDPFADCDCLRITFVDGQYDPMQSDPLDHTGISIERLSNSQKKPDHWANNLFGVLESQGQTPVTRPLAALNTARCTDGVVIQVHGRVRRPILINYKSQSGQSDVMIHHVVQLHADSSLTLLESGQIATRANTVMEMDIGQGAALHHIRTQGPSKNRLCATHMFAQLAAGSRFKSFTLSMNGTLIRNEAVVQFKGDDAHATIAGAGAGNGRDYHHDDTVFVTHDGVNCESRQVFKKVLRNAATAVFQGKILVQPDAQKTDGYQISQALLLDDDSQFLAKPELEIYADDVACSHGSTCGAIDADALFYLRSRGIPTAQAQAMLVEAFLAEVIEEVSDDDLAQVLRDQLPLWLDQV